MIIYILTGLQGTAKTTRLEAWCDKRSGIAGILSPVINGKRYFKSISNGETKLMEATADEKEVQKVGRFIFSSTAFNWAENVIYNAISNNAKLIIIDEIGPLELMGNGFHLLLERLVNADIKNLLLVIRVSKLEEVMAKYNLNSHFVKLITDPEVELTGF
jgi:nucleoside-triphosphatase THEP1